MNVIKQNCPQYTNEVILRVMELPFEYLRVRAQHENLKWEFEIEFFVDSFQNGTRDFFGLNLNDVCFPIFDLQEPYQGFLNNFISWYLLTNSNNNLTLKQNENEKE